MSRQPASLINTAISALEHHGGLVLSGTLLVILVCFIFWPNKALNTSTPATYDQCVKQPGAKLLLTYPAQCVLPDGQHVTQPTASQQSTTSAAPTPQSSSSSAVQK